MLSKRNILTLLIASLLSSFLMLSGVQAQSSKNIVLEMNKAKIIRLPAIASVVAVADPEIANVDVIQPNLISVTGRSVGETTVTAFDGDGVEILNENIAVTHNISALNRIIKQVLPDSDIKFSSIDGALVITGMVDSPIQAEQVQRIATPFLSDTGNTLVNMMDMKHSDQVMLKVRIAEISRTELKRFGINLASVLNPTGNFAFGLVTGRSITGSTPSGILRGGSDNAIGIDYSAGSSFDLNSVIDALAEDNLVKVLAEPNLTTSSGRAANFLAGGEIPIPVPGEDGTVTIDWRPYGVSLEFTPTVVSKNKISLSVIPEVSELSELGSITLQGFDIPGITTRRAETTVELGSGQSFAIAGLMNNNSSNDVSKFPGLGEIPILGALFRSTQFQHNQTELVILVTPYLVRGAPEQELALPTDGFQESNDLDRIFMGSNNVVTPPGGIEAAKAMQAQQETERRAKAAADAEDQPAWIVNESPAQARKSPRPWLRSKYVPPSGPSVESAVVPVKEKAIPQKIAPAISPVPESKPSAPTQKPVSDTAPTKNKPTAKAVEANDQLNGPVGFMLR